MHEASARVVQGSVDSALAVWEGRALHAVNVTGGLHHAMPGAASGFCVYNDAAVGHPRAAGRGCAAGRLRRHRRAPRRRRPGGVLGRPARAHGLGARDRAGAVPGHRPRRARPGGPGAEGTAVNVALPSGTGDARLAARAGRRRARRGARVRPGRPGHAARLRHAPAGPADAPAGERRRAGARGATCCTTWRTRSRTAAGSRSAAAGTPWSTSCRGRGRTCSASRRTTRWTRARRSPTRGAHLVRERYGRLGPDLMTDGRDARFSPWSAGYDPGDDVDRSIRATRAAVFPSLGPGPGPRLTGDLRTPLGRTSDVPPRHPLSHASHAPLRWSGTRRVGARARRAPGGTEERDA